MSNPKTTLGRILLCLFEEESQTTSNPALFVWRRNASRDRFYYNMSSANLFYVFVIASSRLYIASIVFINDAVRTGSAF